MPGEGGGGVAGPRPMSTAVHRSPNKRLCCQGREDGRGWGEPASTTEKKLGFLAILIRDYSKKIGAWCSQTRCQSRRKAGQSSPPAAPLHSAPRRSFPARSPAKTRRNVVFALFIEDRREIITVRGQSYVSRLPKS